MACVQISRYTASNCYQLGSTAGLVPRTRSSCLQQAASTPLQLFIIATSIVPSQWKAASICPVQKVTSPISGQSPSLQCLIRTGLLNPTRSRIQRRGLLASCNSLLYALRILRSHGIQDTSLHDVFRATVIAKLTYCAPSWYGSCSATDRVKLESFVS